VPPREAAAAPLHLRLRTRLDDASEKLALRAALVAAHLLGLAIGRFLREMRGSSDPLVDATALLEEAELRAGIAWDIVDILGARLDKIPDRHRPYYTPSQRFRILQIRSLLGWNRDLAARTFRICPNTLSNWEKHADPNSKTAGSTVKPIPPITRFADVSRSLVQAMLRLGFGGEDLVARVLARAGWKVSARSVRRMGRESQASNPTPTIPIGGRLRNPVVARFVNHVWMMDVSVVQAFLGGELYLGAVFDAFSRAPLAMATFERRPGLSHGPSPENRGSDLRLAQVPHHRPRGGVHRIRVRQDRRAARRRSTLRIHTEHLCHGPDRKILENPQAGLEPSTPSTLDHR
jgi:hypothetical protein